MKFAVALFFMFFVLISINIAAAAPLSCLVQNAGTCTTPGSAGIMMLTGDDNAHAATMTGGVGYSHVLCCTGPQDIGNSCDINSDVVVRLTDTYNAHASDKNGDTGTYPQPICLTSQLPAYCEAILSTQTCDSIGSGYTCVVKISDSDDAHVSSCAVTNSYDYKICCKAEEDLDGPVIDMEGLSKANDGTRDEYSNSITVYAVGLDSGDGEWCMIEWEPTVWDVFPASLTSRSHTYTTEGRHDIEYACNDTYGNWPKYPMTNASDYIMIDTTDPNVWFQSTSVTPQNSPTVTIVVSNNADGAGVGIDSCEIRWEASGSWESVSNTAYLTQSHTYSTDGTKTISYRCNDLAGNLNTTSNSTVIDTTPPLTEDKAVSSSYSSPALIDLECTDSSSGCGPTYYCSYAYGASECTPTQLGTGVALTCPEGTICEYYVRYYSIDNAGNEEDPPKRSDIITLDTTLPSCTIEMTPTGTYVTSTPVTLSWTSSESSQTSTVRVFYEQNDDGVEREIGTGFTYNAPGQMSTEFTVIDGTEYTFYCKPITTDSRIGTSANTISTTAILSAPTLSITPIPQWSTGEIDLSWSVDNPTNVKCYYAYWKNDTVWHHIVNATGGDMNCVDTTSVTFDQQSTPFVDGTTYGFRIVVEDIVTNTEDGEVSTLMDLNPPSCNMTPFTQTTTSDPAISLSWIGADDASGLRSYTIESSNDGTTWTPLTGAVNITGTSMVYTAPSEDEYYFRCIATDNVYRTGTSTPINILYDTSGPAINAVYNASIGLDDDLEIHVTVTDQVLIQSVVLTHSGTLITPDSKTEISDTEWYMVWTIQPNHIGQDNFTVTTENINERTESQTFPFNTKECVFGITPPRSCESNVGECRNGTRLCQSNDLWGACENFTGPIGEVCDNKDNNCNGIIDEDVYESCGYNLGICSQGVRVCTLGTWGSCIGGTLPEATDICGDSLDNNCDGQVDEGCVCVNGETQICGTDVGECQKGTQTCTNGAWGICVGEIIKVTEICDGKDNDCDGLTDEGNVCGSISYNDTCFNGVQDSDEDGVDCGGVCIDDCPEPDNTWMYLIVAGVVVLIVLLLLIMYFKSQGKDLTWDELSNKWSGEPSDEELDEEFV